MIIFLYTTYDSYKSILQDCRECSTELFVDPHVKIPYIKRGYPRLWYSSNKYF